MQVEAQHLNTEDFLQISHINTLLMSFHLGGEPAFIVPVARCPVTLSPLLRASPAHQGFAIILKY